MPKENKERRSMRYALRASVVPQPAFSLRAYRSSSGIFLGFFVGKSCRAIRQEFSCFFFFGTTKYRPKIGRSQTWVFAHLVVCKSYLEALFVPFFFAPIGAPLRSFADLRLHSFTLICVIFALIFVFLHPIAFRTTGFWELQIQASGNFGAFFERNFVTQKTSFVPSSFCRCQGFSLKTCLVPSSFCRRQGFSLKRALAQTCLLAWYQVRFFKDTILGHSWGLVYGEGGTSGTLPLHNLRVTSNVLHQDAPPPPPRVVPSRFLITYVLGILRGPGEGEHGVHSWYGTTGKTHRSLHGRHA